MLSQQPPATRAWQSVPPPLAYSPPYPAISPASYDTASGPGYLGYAGAAATSAARPYLPYSPYQTDATLAAAPAYYPSIPQPAPAWPAQPPASFVSPTPTQQTYAPPSGAWGYGPYLAPAAPAVASPYPAYAAAPQYPAPAAALPYYSRYLQYASPPAPAAWTAAAPYPALEASGPRAGGRYPGAARGPLAPQPDMVAQSGNGGGGGGGGGGGTLWRLFSGSRAGMAAAPMSELKTGKLYRDERRE